MKPYKELRNKLRAQDISHEYYATKIRRSVWYVEHRINAHAPWSQNDMYNTLDLLCLPHDQLHIIFPPNGISSQEKARKEITIDPGMRAALAKIGELFILAANSAED